MNKLAGLAIVATSACSSQHAPSPACGDGTMLAGEQCVATMSACGSGTHDEGGTCIADVTTSYSIRVAPMIAADGKTATRVFVFGAQSDGFPATDLVVLNTDRPGAGVFQRSQLTLGSLQGETEFVPCALSTPGCAGPLSLTAALASAPTAPVAHVDTMLVDPALLDPARACLGGGNVLYLSGNDSILDGTVTITNATWNPIAYSDLVELDVTPVDPMQGTSWQLRFGVSTFGYPLTPNYYPNAQRWYATYGSMMPLMPDMLVDGNGNSCDSITGSFVLEAFDGGNSIRNFTAAFEQHCNGSTTTVLTGCVHWSS